MSDCRLNPPASFEKFDKMGKCFAFKHFLSDLFISFVSFKDLGDFVEVTEEDLLSIETFFGQDVDVSTPSTQSFDGMASDLNENQLCPQPIPFLGDAESFSNFNPFPVGLKKEFFSLKKGLIRLDA